MRQRQKAIDSLEISDNYVKCQNVIYLFLYLGDYLGHTLIESLF